MPATSARHACDDAFGPRRQRLCSVATRRAARAGPQVIQTIGTHAHGPAHIASGDPPPAKTDMPLRRAIASVVLLLALATGLPAPAADLPPAARAALDRLLDKARSTHSDAVLVLHDGRPIGRYDRDGAPPGTIELMSATKSVVALGIGQLLADGRIRSLDQPVADFYPEWKQGLKADVTVRMLLDH